MTTGKTLALTRWTIVGKVMSLLFNMLSRLIREKAMAPHSSTVAWKIPWMEEPGRLQSMGSLRVGHDWATSLSRSTFMHWRRKWQPTPVFLPGESHRRRSLVGCSPWGRTELDTTEATEQQQQVDHNFSSKEQVSFNFMAAITICSDFGAPKNKVSHCFHF